MIPRNKALLFAILSTCFSSIAVIYHAIAAKEIPIFQAIAVSNTSGGLILLSFLLLRREKIDWKTLLNHKFDFFMVMMCRFIVGTIILWKAMSLTLGIKAMFFSKVEPYFILLWQWILDGVTIPLGHFYLLLVHFLGAVILSGGDFSELGPTQIGDLLLLVAMSIYALSYRFASRLTTGVSPLSLAMLTQLTSGLLFFPLALMYQPLMTWQFEGPGWFALFMTVILWNLLGFPFWFIALKGLPGWLVSALRALGPVVAAPIAIIFFGQHLSTWQWAGAAIVISTSFLLARERR